MRVTIFGLGTHEVPFFANFTTFHLWADPSTDTDHIEFKLGPAVSSDAQLFADAVVGYSLV